MLPFAVRRAVLRPARVFRQTRAIHGQMLSVGIRGQPSKQEVLDQVRDQLLQSLRQHWKHAAEEAVATGPRTPHNQKAVVLATPDFARWLEDEDFMRSFLSMIARRSPLQVTPWSLDVLAGVVDGLSPKRLLGNAERGFSILCGSGLRLPGLLVEDETKPTPNHDAASSITFTASPLPGRPQPVNITLPLANTVFQTGRRSTLFGSRWESDGRKALCMSAKSYKLHQLIEHVDIENGSLKPRIHLLPLTRPRKIVSALGNIVREVDIDGTPTPASKELEAVIPKLLDRRSEGPGPVGIWAWVVPDKVAEEVGLFNLGTFETQAEGPEWQPTMDSADVFTRLLTLGCRLHRILSGGGGWGAKQGLLSLDPDTGFSDTEEEVVDDFISAFEERGGKNPSAGLATPGSYILFCTEPVWSNVSEGRQPGATTKTSSRGMNPALKTLSTFTLGVNSPMESSNAKTSDAAVVPGKFGIVSASALYLWDEPQWAVATPARPWSTKIDAPRTTFLLNTVRAE